MRGVQDEFAILFLENELITFRDAVLLDPRARQADEQRIVAELDHLAAHRVKEAFSLFKLYFVYTYKIVYMVYGKSIYHLQALFFVR